VKTFDNEAVVAVGKELLEVRFLSRLNEPINAVPTGGWQVWPGRQ
jgi:hypothetical protein